MARAKEKGEQRDIASERVSLLFSQAESLASSGDLDSASMRVRRAHDICLRFNLRLPPELRMRFCRGCLTYFTSATSRRRLDSKNHRTSLRCLVCGRVAYRPYSRAKRGR